MRSQFLKSFDVKLSPVLASAFCSPVYAFSPLASFSSLSVARLSALIALLSETNHAKDAPRAVLHSLKANARSIEISFIWRSPLGDHFVLKLCMVMPINWGRARCQTALLARSDLPGPLYVTLDDAIVYCLAARINQRTIFKYAESKIMIGKKAKILSDEHITRLLSFASTTRYPARNRVIVLLSLKAGLRAGEIAKLTWPMVLDPDGRIALVIELRD